MYKWQMKKKLTLQIIIGALIIYYIYSQDILQVLKTKLILLVGFGLLSGWLINKYIK